ncbi:MAG: SIMPL domain-containing protein [Bacteroidales bacterium]|nr:SIMPL domain-containing protein [Bacteroidales bacterium]
MQNLTNTKAAILGLSIGLGILFAGLFISNALYKARVADRYVTVKGLAEREMDADLAIWPITYKDAGNDLLALQKSIDEKRRIISGFLIEKGFKEKDINHSSPKITDTYAEGYYGNQQPQGPRYRIQKTVTLRSSNVELVKQTMEKSGELVFKGIALSESWENRTEFLFTSLNSIKPEMIREATINAREAAETFAEDSGSKIGKIRKATQGFFSISDRDANSPDRKIIRVVTTMEYYLVDN